MSAAAAICCTAQGYYQGQVKAAQPQPSTQTAACWATLTPRLLRAVGVSQGIQPGVSACTSALHGRWLSRCVLTGQGTAALRRRQGEDQR
jgi:hypothetical protein